MVSPNEKITLVGAGLAGSYLACLLLKEGYDVEIFERRPDMRKDAVGGGRSINLAISKRGLDALKKIDLVPVIKEKLIPMEGRQIHHSNGEESFQIYGAHQGEGINSVSRAGLNSILMTEAERLGANIHFSAQVTSVDFSKKEALVSQEGQISKIKYQRIVGTDGSGSAVRDAICREGHDFAPEMLEYGYKELTIPPQNDGSFAIEKNALHIWPRRSFMLIGLPNPDGSFTGTLFLPLEGEGSFQSFGDSDSFVDFFKKEFSDACDLIPNLKNEFEINPVGSLGTIRMSPWYFEDQALLLGDAAHGVVPFYGQGMNCAFESCHEFVSELKEKQWDWAGTLPNFMEKRKPHADAIADLAIRNFEEMKDHVADRDFLLQKEVLKGLEERVDGFRTEYSLVTFTNTPYAEALNLGNKQKAMIQGAMKGISRIEDVDWQVFEALAQQYLQENNLI